MKENITEQLIEKEDIKLTPITVSSTKTNYTSASTIDEAVCYDLQNTENIETYSDETKKALSVIYRTNHKIKNDYQNQKYTNLNQELLDITKSTSNETLSLKNNTLFEINKNNYLWTKKIKKSQLLNFLYKNNISVANISKVSLSVSLTSATWKSFSPSFLCLLMMSSV